MKFTIYLIKRMYNDIWCEISSAVYFIASMVINFFMAKFILVNFLNNGDTFLFERAFLLSILLYAPEIALLAFIGYLINVHDDYEEIETDKYVEKIKAKRGSDHV